MRTIPKKVTELGRIRIGDQVATSSGKGKRPRKLDAFRLTSSNQHLLSLAANLYGGTVQRWEDAPVTGQWELYTTANSMNIVLPTALAVSLSYEIWQGGGCTRRCTGSLITHSPLAPDLIGTPCQCPGDDEEWTGERCPRVMRLNVLLPDLPGVGVWRLDTKGYYATAELLGLLEMLDQAGMSHGFLEAALRLEQRTVKRLLSSGKSETRRFVVPTIAPKYTFRQLAEAQSTRRESVPLLQQQQSIMDDPAEQAKTLQAHVADLYGDGPALEAQTVAAEYVPRIEALAHATGQKLEVLWPWAVRQYHHTSQQEMTREDYASLLARMEKYAKERQAAEAVATTPTEAGVSVTIDQQPEPSSHPTEPSWDWREGLRQMANDTLALLSGEEPEALAHRVHGAVGDALKLADREEATEAEGIAAMETLTRAGEAVVEL